MESKERYFKALIENKGLLNEIDLGEKIYLEENDIREIISQLLAEYRIRYKENSVCNYTVVNNTSR